MGATGEVHLRGVLFRGANQTTASTFNGIHEIDLITTSEENYEYVFQKSGAITPKLHIWLTFLMALLQLI